MPTDQEPVNSDIRRLTFSVDEVSQLLGLSRSAVYERIARGDIPAKRFGRRILVVRAAIDELLGHPDQPTPRIEHRRPA